MAKEKERPAWFDQAPVGLDREEVDPELVELGDRRGDQSPVRPLLMVMVLVLGGYILSDWREELGYFMQGEQPVAIGSVTEFPTQLAEGRPVKIPHNTYVEIDGIPSKRSISPKAQFFKLIGGEANAVASLKRPLSSMSPTIVLEGDQPVMTVGAAGGPRIITATLLAIVRHLEFGWPLEKALGEHRFHHQWVPGELTIEEGFEAEQSRKLEALGHKLKISRRSAMSEAQAIRRDPKTGRFEGYADPRTAGTAAGD